MVNDTSKRVFKSRTSTTRSVKRRKKTPKQRTSARSHQHDCGLGQAQGLFAQGRYPLPGRPNPPSSSYSTTIRVSIRGHIHLRIPWEHKYPAVQVFAIAGFQRLAFDQFESSCSVGLPFSSQEEGVSHSSILETVRKFIQMRDEENLEVFFQ